MQRHQNTFIEGLDKDTAVNKYSNTKFFNSENFRLIVNEENATGALVNVKGTELSCKFTSIKKGSTFKIIGLDKFPDKLVVFVHVSTGNTGIFVIPFEDLSTTFTIDPFSGFSVYRYYSGNFGFTNDSKIKTICRIENDNIHKIYFTDSVTPIKVINVAPSNKNNLAVTPIDKLEIIPDSILHKPEFVELTTGSLQAGRVQYAYQLYNLYGSESMFSAASDLVNLTTFSETSDYKNFKGSDIGTNSGKGVTITVSDIDSRYDRIRIVRVLYEELNLEPSIATVYEGEFDSSLTITDSGNLNLGEYTIEEFNELTLNPIPQTFETKNDRLFIANTKEETFDFDYDASVKRYKYTGINLETYDTLGNPYNVYDRDPLDEYKLHSHDLSNGPILGGVGDNVEYQFRTKRIKLDATANFKTFGEVPASEYSYANSENHSKYVGYQRDEIYRFGLVGYNKKMQPSFVKWIDDIRFPDFKDVGETYDLGTGGLTPAVPAKQVVEFYNNPWDESTYWELTFTINGVSTVRGMLNAATASETLSQFVSGFSSNAPFGKIYIASSSVDSPTQLTIEFQCDSDEYSLFIEAYGSVTSDVGYDVISTQAYVPPTGDSGIIENDFKLTVEDAGTLYANVLYPAFKLKNLPSDIEAVQIVRAKRDRNNRTVIDLGLAGGLVDADSPYTKRYSDTSKVEAATTTNNLLEYVSSEHSINRLHTINGTHLEVLGVYDLNSSVINFANSSIHSTFHINKYKVPAFSPTIIASHVIEEAQNHINSRQLTSSTTIDTEVVKNEVVGTAKRTGTKGSCKLIKTATTLNDINSPICRRRYGQYPYGGITESALSVTEYIPVSDVIRVDSDVIQAERFFEVFGGDTYIGYFEYMRALWEADVLTQNQRIAVVDYIPVESTINLQYLNNPTFNSTYDGIETDLGKIPSRGIQETVGNWLLNKDGDYYIQTFNLYTYNSVYSKENDSKRFYPKPADIAMVTNNPVRTYYSDRKINGEFVDRWTKFRPNNYLDVDTKYGAITRIYNFKDTIFYLQKEAVGAFLIEPKELIPSSTPGPLLVGIGAVLDRYQYISTISGLSDYYGVIASKAAIYYFDRLNRKICRVEEGGSRFLSDEKSISSLTRSIELSDSVILGTDNDYSEVLLYLGGTKTLVFNELLNTFSGFYSFVPAWFVATGNSMFSVSNSDFTKIHKHNVGEYATFYEQEPADSKLTIIVNPGGNTVCIYDVIELTLEVLADNNDNTENLCVDSIRLYNEYQDTGNLLLTSEDNVIQRFRTWRINTLVDNTEVDEPRLRSASIFMDITYNNLSNYKLILHDIITKFRSTVLR